METMSEILLDRLAQESNLVDYESSDDESLNKPLDEPLDEPSDEPLDKPLDESYGQSYQTVFWTVLVHLTAPVSNRPLRSPGNVQAPAEDHSSHARTRFPH